VHEGWAGLLAPSAARPAGRTLCRFRGEHGVHGATPISPPRETLAMTRLCWISYSISASILGSRKVGGKSSRPTETKLTVKQDIDSRAGFYRSNRGLN
jgi:hypothetical protein